MTPPKDHTELFETIVDSLPVCISYVDIEQRYRYNNPCYEEWFHVKAEDCYGKRIREVIGPDAYRVSKANIEKALTGKMVSFEAAFQTSFGVSRTNRVIFQPDFDASGKCIGFAILAVDISEEKNAIYALESSKQQFKLLFEVSPAGIVIFAVTETGNKTKLDFLHLKVNNSWSKHTGIPSDRVLGKTFTEAFPNAESHWAETFTRVAKTGKSENIEEYFVELNRFFTVTVFRPQEGLIACSFLDITDQKLKEQRIIKKSDQVLQNFERVNKYLATNRKRLKTEVGKRTKYEKKELLSDAIFLNTAEGICITDSDAIIQQINPAFTAITGYQEAEVLGENPRILKSDHHDAEFYEDMWKSLTKRGSWAGEIWNRRKDGDAYLEYLEITAITDKKRNVLNYVAVFHDISELHSSREQIAYHMSYDALTGLPNRSLFDSYCSKQIGHAEKYEEEFAVALLDLDNFKEINETLGYDLGDLLLQKVATRIGSCCRNQDTVARLGGDEFVILLPDLGNSIDDVLIIMSRIMEKLSECFTISSEPVFTKSSIGVSVYPAHGDTSQSLLQKAEIALYEAKSLGGSRVKIFTERAQQAVQRKIALKNSLRLALERDEFELYYQPKVDLVDDSIIGAEALIRWNREDGQLVPPDEFIPLAEESELITEIGSWVIEEAASQLKSWHDQGLTDFTMAINLSARQFVDPDLLDRLYSAIDRYELNTSDLHLEITEHTMVEQIEKTVAIMEDITEHGFVISIDDFGTGFSSLAYLKQFPISTLKIDRTFVKNLPDDNHDKTIIHLTLTLAKSLGMSVIAEGVETEEQMEFLRELGCDEYQGYYCSRPLPAFAFEEFLSDRTAV